MKAPLPESTLAQLFTQARSHHAWRAEPVSDEQLRQVFELAKWGPTCVNSVPMRVLFLRSESAREKLYPALLGKNVTQSQAAPVTAIIAQDTKFYDHLPTLFPFIDARALYATNAPLAEATAFRNSSLQGAYFMLAARALGLDVCPMSGFDNAKVDATFFAGTSWKSNFICTMGYGDETKLHPRGPRLSFEECCKIR